MTASPEQPIDLLTRFSAAVRRAPDRPAVRHRNVVLSFAELEERTARLASALRSRGAGPGRRVGVSLPRGADLVVALLAVWRTGAAYVPLDPSYPADRLAFMVEDAGAGVLLHLGERPPWAGRAEIVAPDATGPDALLPSPGAPAPHDAGPPAPTPAYVIYTSGSTGRPKGVEVSRGAVASLVTALERSGMYAAQPRVVGWNASVSFDASVQQWVRVCRGDTVVVLDDRDRTDPARLRALLDAYAVTDLDLTPSHWEILREELLAPFADGRVPRLFIGGEAVSERAWRELAEADGVEALNLYGPTECTVDATAAWISGEGPHIGRPLLGNQVYVLDDALRPAPPGVTGELYIAGPRLAAGYVGAPALTAARFVADPFSGRGARMYRTGDRAHRSADGVLTFAGRADGQVKVRGFRVELGEIEHALGARQDVARAVVTLRDERLVAYLVPADGEVPSVQRLRDHLAATLPDFMVPTEFVLIERVPLTPNGKPDLAALPEPTRATETGRAPRGEFEELIASVWSEVLGRDGIGSDDDFFALGGHSLMAIRVVARLRKNLGVVVPTRQVYRHPRLHDLARYVESLHRTTAPDN